MNSIGRICIYVYISSNTRIYSISPEGFIQACVSVTLFQGGVQQKKNIYNATPGGGRAFFFCSTPPLYIYYIYIFFWLDPPLLPVRRKCAGCGQWELDRCHCQVKKMEHLGTSTGDTWGRSKGDTWGRSRDTQG